MAESRPGEAVFRVPTDPEFLQNLVLQRTGPFIALGGATALQHWFATGQKAQLSAFLAERGLVGDYLQRSLQEVTAEVAALSGAIGTAGGQRVVSIGPGNGLFELVLLRRMNISQILLIDIEFSEETLHGFNQNGSGYASLVATKAFLVDNGIETEKILTLNPRLEPLVDFRFDLLISILSMGFHYPCDDYAAFMLRNANPGGLIVLDKRRGATDPGFETVSKALSVQASTPSAKSDRIVLANPA